MAADPLDLLLPRYRRQVLARLLLQPDDALHVREIARLTGVPAGSLHRELRTLTEAGLLLWEPLGNQVHYRANRNCPIFGELAALLRKAEAQPRAQAAEAAHPPTAALEALAKRHHIRRLVLFGSAARGELRPDSDVDVLVEFEPGRAPSLWAEDELQASMSKLFDGRRVDIAPPAILRNAFRRKAIERDMKVLYDAAS